MQPTTIDTNIGRIRKAVALMAFGAASLPGAGFAATDNALLPRNLSPWGMFVNADIVVQAVMVGLAIASLITWTVWLAKTIEISRAHIQREATAGPARERAPAGRCRA